MAFLTETTPEEIQRFPLYQPEQESYLNQILKMGMPLLQNPMAGFAPIKEEAMRQFQQELLPQLAERFAGTGNLMGGALQSLGGAASQFQSMLADMQARYAMANQENALRMLSMGLTPRYESMLRPATSQPTGFGNFLNWAAPIAGGALGSFLGPVGTAAGTALGSGLSSWLTRSPQQSQSQTSQMMPYNTQKPYGSFSMNPANTFTAMNPNSPYGNLLRGEI
jgi:hypothetical protein